MASLYKRGQYYWLEFRDAYGRRVQHSTGLRHALAHETREARRLRDAAGALEAKQARGSPFGVKGEAFASWVGRFLSQRYASSPLTFQRARYAWDAISAFWRVKGISNPRQVSRQLCRDFVEWRCRPGGTACRNTALVDVRYLRLIMQEAVESGFCDSNPCLKLGLSGSPSRKKPAITIEEHRKIIHALRQLRKRDNARAWMLVAYRIGYYQGFRLSETRFPISQVDLVRGVVGVHTKAQKKNQIAEFPLNPRLRPMFRRLILSGASFTYDRVSRATASTDFRRFFHSIGLSGLCFHCTRVSFVTRCYEAGIPQEMAMRLSGHLSYAAHSVYPRIEAHGTQLQDLMKRLGG